MADILIAEDDVHMLRILSMWLSRNGHSVVEAPNGLAAQEHLKREAFDLVVSDVNMPGLDGIRLVRWLRRERRSWIPVVLLTSRCDQTVLAEELDELGVHLHPKPFSPSRLASEIEERLKEETGPEGTMQRANKEGARRKHEGEEERDEGTKGRSGTWSASWRGDG